MPFRIYKLRTMKNGKITLIGQVLRKTGIDEIPQLINVLKLEMSIVGPRPLTKKDIVRLEWDSEFYNKRWNMRPGIVGLAQLSPMCHKKMSWFYDHYYIAQNNFMMDIKIICASAVIPILGKKKVKKWIHKKKNHILKFTRYIGVPIHMHTLIG